MAAEVKKEIALEIAHVLFIDIVAYSKMASDDQRAAIEKLNQIVQSTDEFRKEESENRLLKLATGDGMALIFYHSPEDPVECALEISRAIKEQHSNLRLRMGVHSGPVSGVVDVNGRANVAGAGINTAQRVMDCGDAGHILLSTRVAEDLEQFKHWRPHLYHIGECEVKHGDKIEIVNLFTAELGNSERPKRMAMPAQKADFEPVRKERAPSRKQILTIAACLAVAALAAAAFLFWQRHESKPSATALSIPEKSIAVLPFENLSEEKQNAYFADGVQDEILTDLAKVADLKVISRTSVIGYRDTAGRNLRKIGQELGVAHLLEGSVQRAGNRVRVNAQLIDARNDAHLWAQTYDRDLADIFAIQSEIAKAIADQLQAKLSPTEKQAIERRPTNDLVAFDLYTRAKDLLTAAISSSDKAARLQAIELLNQAVARDPSFFDAYCQLAYAHGLIYLVGSDHTPARLALADAAVGAAARLRPDAGETHLARAQNLYQGHLDYNGALAELELARQTLPNDARIYQLMGFIQRRQPGRYEEATRTLEHAIDLDPRNVRTLNQIAAFNYPRLRRYADAKSAWDRVLAIHPDDPNAKVSRASVDFDWKADTQPLHQTIDSIRATNPAALHGIADNWVFCALAERDTAAAKNALVAAGEKSIVLTAGNVVFNRPFMEGVIARMTHDDAAAQSAFSAARSEQEKILQAQPNHAQTLCVLGLIDAGLGRKDEAIQEGRRAIELLPVEKDLPEGTDMIKYLAMIAAWGGDKDLACEQLTIALSGPSGLTYGELKLLPLWDPLRGDPRFESIVASLAPK
jgi:TolB-like protein/Tfp pilus assembly protein PilF